MTFIELPTPLVENFAGTPNATPIKLSTIFFAASGKEDGIESIDVLASVYNPQNKVCTLALTYVKDKIPTNPQNSTNNTFQDALNRIGNPQKFHSKKYARLSLDVGPFHPMSHHAGITILTPLFSS